MWQRLEEGYTQATDLAEFVMLRCGVDYRAAYLIVGEVVRERSRRGIRGVDITPADLDAPPIGGRALRWGSMPTRSGPSSIPAPSSRPAAPSVGPHRRPSTR